MAAGVASSENVILQLYVSARTSAVVRQEQGRFVTPVIDAAWATMIYNQYYGNEAGEVSPIVSWVKTQEQHVQARFIAAVESLKSSANGKRKKH